MAINKKLIHFKNKQNFENEVANNNILDTSIVFILDSKEISTHGTLYKTVNWSVLLLITFKIDNESYMAEEGMTWGEWVDSEYNTAELYTDNGNSVCLSNNTFLYTYDIGFQYVRANDVIVSNNEYSLFTIL